MNKGVAIAGGVTLLLSGISLIFGFVTLMGYEPNEDNTLHDTRIDGKTFDHSGYPGYLDVFVVGDVFCFDYLYENDLQILNSSGENVFYGNCDTEYASTDYTYVGSIDAMEAEEFTIVSEGDIVIIDGGSVFGSVFAVCCGMVCGLVGIIALIVGLATGGNTPQVMVYQQPDGTMHQPNQTTVHQYIPPSGAQPTQQQVVAQPQVQEPQSIPSAFEENPNDVPVYQTDFDGFSFEHKKDD